MTNTIEVQNKECIEIIYNDALSIIAQYSNGLRDLLLDLNFSMYKVRLSRDEIKKFSIRLDEAEKFINSNIIEKLNDLKVINDKINETFENWLIVDPKEDVRLAEKICKTYLSMELHFLNFREYLEDSEINIGKQELEDIKIKLLKIFPVEIMAVINNQEIKNANVI